MSAIETKLGEHNMEKVGNHTREYPGNLRTVSILSITTVDASEDANEAQELAFQKWI